MAQLVARLHGMEKVRGSNPLTSTAEGPRSEQGSRPFTIHRLGYSFMCAFGGRPSFIARVTTPPTRVPHTGYASHHVTYTSRHIAYTHDQIWFPTSVREQM